MKIVVPGATDDHILEAPTPALRAEDIEPEVGNVFVGIAYAVLFSVILFYIGLSIWHMCQ